MRINKKKVQKNFSIAADHYDQIASLQSETGRQLLSFLTVSQCSRIIDIGTGTGRLLWDLADMFPEAHLYGCDLAFGMIKQACMRGLTEYDGSGASPKPPVFIQADAENLPYRSDAFDLMISNLAYQWISNLKGAFGEVYRLLKPKGEFCFSTFSEGTLSELHDSFQEAYQKLKGKTVKTHSHVFISSQKLEESLHIHGFSKIIMREWICRKIYSDVNSLLVELKALGASNATLDSSYGLGGRKILKEMISCYEKHFQHNEGIPATYKIILARGEK